MAKFVIDQTGLPAGTLDKSRTDGLSTGALVTLDASAGGGNTFLFQFLWVPLGDTTAVASLVATGNPAIWTFSPTASKPGTYRIKLTIDETLPTESVITRHFVVRTPTQGLVIPPLNGVADPDASLLLSGPSQVSASEENSADYTSDVLLNNFSYAGWWRALYEIIQTVEAGSGGGTPGGADTEIQFNNAGAFGGSSNHRFQTSGGETTVSVKSNTILGGIARLDLRNFVGTSKVQLKYIETGDSAALDTTAISISFQKSGIQFMSAVVGALLVGGSTVSARAIGVDGQSKELNDTQTSNGTPASGGGTLDLALPAVTLSKTEIYSVKSKTVTGGIYDYYRATVIVQRDGTSTLINRVDVSSGFTNPDFVISVAEASDVITVTFTNNSGTITVDTTISASIESEDIPA